MGTAFLIVTGIMAFIFFLFGNILALLSLTGGWRRLSLVHPAPAVVQPDSVTYSFQSIRLGFVNYNRCVFIKFTGPGIIVSTFWPFTFMHSPFIIRYELIHDITKGNFFGPYVAFSIEGKKIRMQGRCVAEFEKRMVQINSGHTI